MKMSRRDCLACAGGLAAQGAHSLARSQAGPSLIAHWKLNGDCRDAAGRHDGVAHGLAFVEGPGGAIKAAARFDGIESFIEVAHAAPLKFAADGFSIAAWVKLESDVTTVIGDILSKYDPRNRKGLNLSVGSSSPGYSSIGDAKNLHFGIDNGINGSWLDCGRPWKTRRRRRGRAERGVGRRKEVFRSGTKNFLDNGRENPILGISDCPVRAMGNGRMARACSLDVGYCGERTAVHPIRLATWPTRREARGMVTPEMLRPYLFRCDIGE